MISLAAWLPACRDIADLTELDDLVSVRFNRCAKLTGDIAVFRDHRLLQKVDFAGCPAIRGDLRSLSRLTKLQFVDLSGSPEIFVPHGCPRGADLQYDAAACKRLLAWLQEI